MSELRRTGTAVLGATVLLGILLAVGPVATEKLVAGWVLALAGIAFASLLRVAAQRDEPSRFERALARPRPVELRPAELVAVERELLLGEASAGQAHRRLLPLLREAAAARLAAAHDVDLERRPGRARELLGDEAWELLRPDRPAPAERSARGVTQAQVARVVTALERL